MKKTVLWLLLILAVVLFIGCSKDDSLTIPPVNNDTPIISFVMPVAGDSVVKGGTMQIKIKMKVNNYLITKVNFWVDDYLSRVLTGQSSVVDTIRTFNWTAPDSVGTHSFKVIGQTLSAMEGCATVANIRVVNAGTTPSNMVLVSGGTFQMGANNLSDARPVHPVTISSFYIGKYEVTQAEWVATMSSNPSNFTGDLNRPVECVSWYDIMVYCNKRSIAEGLTPVYSINGSINPANWGSVPISNNSTWDAATCNWSAKGYRLPTEAEWEFAARGGKNSNGYTYSGSNTIGDVAWFSDNSNITPHVVGTKAPNELGIYDMSGNVCEWNWDWVVSYSSSAQTNPHGAATGSSRICRGGSCSPLICYYCLVAWRYNFYPYSRSDYLGFRLARPF